MASTITRFKLVFFVPPNALSACKTAIFNAGAGRFPGYTECCFLTRGTGQFRPGDTANPHIGKVGELEEVDEYRVEAICSGRDTMVKVVEALKKYVLRKLELPELIAKGRILMKSQLTRYTS